jgi:hypothetical protein
MLFGIDQRTTCMRRRLPVLLAALLGLTVLVPAPARAVDVELVIEAFVGGAPATDPGPEVDAGSQAFLTFEITNPGADDLYALYLRVDGLGRIDCPERHLRPGATIVCETAVTVAAGPVAFDAVAKAWPDGDGEAVARTTVTYTGVTPTETNLVNAALGKPARHASTQQWTIGTDAGLAVDGDRNGDIDGGSVAITYRVSEAWWEVDLGAVTDIDHVVLWNRTDCCTERLHRVHVFVSDEEFPVRDIDGIASDPSVHDVFLDRTLGRRTDVPIGRSGRFVRVQLDYLDAVLALAEVEVMVPVASQTSAPPAVAVADPAADPAAGIDLEVLANGLPTGSPGPTLVPGDGVAFSYRITNTGTATLWSPFVWHDGEGKAECPRGRIDPGAAVECTLASTVETGSTSTVVTAQAWAEDGTEADASRTVHLIGGDTDTSIGLALAVTADGQPTDAAPGPGLGASATFAYRVTNTGSSNLWALTIWHDGVGDVVCAERAIPAGATVVCEADAAVRAGDDDVTAWAWDDAGRRASSSVTVFTSAVVAGPESALSLQAAVAGDDADAAPGPTLRRDEPATFSFAVTNEGSNRLYGLWIGAGPVGSVTCDDRTLDPGETVTCLTTVAAESGIYSAVTKAVAYAGSGDEVVATDPLHWYVPETAGPAVTLEYLIDGISGDNPWGPRLREGDVGTFTYIVSNVGDEPLSNVTVTDDRHGAIDCPASVVAAGATMVCSVDEMMRLSRVETWATVTAEASSGAVTDSERLYYHVKPFGREDQLLLEVTIDGHDADTAPGPTFEVGRTVTIRYLVTNNSNSANQWSAQVFDPRVPADRITCQGGPTLNHYASMVCTATIRIEQGAWSNQVTATSFSTNGVRLDASDRLHYTGVL